MLLCGRCLPVARAMPWYFIWPAALAGLSTATVKLGGVRRHWPWSVVAGLSAILMAGQLWVEWGVPGI